MKLNGLVFLVFLILGIACESPVVDQSATQKSFFDLKAYFAGEIQKLSKLKSFEKSTQINGEKETRQLETLDFNQELALFIESDINRVAWLDEYQVDSTFAAGGALSSIVYQAKDPSLKTQKVYIDFQEDEPTQIRIDKLAENALMNATMKLEYEAGRGYRIQSNQKLRMSDEREMVVEVVVK